MPRQAFIIEPYPLPLFRRLRRQAPALLAIAIAGLLTGCVSINNVWGSVPGEISPPVTESLTPIQPPPLDHPDSEINTPKENHSQNPSDSPQVGEPGDGPSGSKDDITSANDKPRQFAIDPVRNRLRPIGTEQDDEIRSVLLTIDDGPRGPLTLEILDVLKQYDVPAIFFVNGIHFSKNTEEIRRIHSDGHLIGNHAWSHLNLTKLSSEEMRKEIEETSIMIQQLTGISPIYFRAPFGAYTPEIRQVAAELGMQSVNWSIDPRDWSYDDSDPGDGIAAHIVEHLHPGAIILIHQQRATLSALPAIIEGVRAQGYEFVLPTDLIMDDDTVIQIVQS